MQLAILIIMAIVYCTFMFLSERARRQTLKDWGNTIDKLKDACALIKIQQEEIDRYRKLELTQNYDDLRVKYNELRDCCKGLQRQIRDEAYGTVTVTGPLTTDVIKK
jgi:hypothetical protein